MSDCCLGGRPTYCSRSPRLGWLRNARTGGIAARVRLPLETCPNPLQIFHRGRKKQPYKEIHSPLLQVARTGHLWFERSCL